MRKRKFEWRERLPAGVSEELEVWFSVLLVLVAGLLLFATLTAQAARAAPFPTEVGAPTLLFQDANGSFSTAAPLETDLRLSVAGRLGDDSADGGVDPRSGPVRTPGLHPARAGRLATACLIGGFGLLTVAEVRWAHAIGVTMLLAAIALGLAAAAPRLLEDNES